MIFKKIPLIAISLLLLLVLAMPASSVVCVDQQPGDTHRFGDSLAASEKYLAIGDTQANRVVVYRNTASNEWERFRIVALPPNPPVSDPSANFGYNITYSLAIDRETLVIGKVVSKYQPKADEKQFYPFQPPVRPGMHNASGMAYAGAVYRTELNSNSPLRRVDKLKSQELAGFSVAAAGGRIAFAVFTYEPLGYTMIMSRNQFSTLHVGGKIAMNDNLLVVGSMVDNHQGKISIFNLANSNLSPRTVEIPVPVNGVTMTDKFIAVSEQLYVNQFPHANPHLSKTPRILIINIGTLATTAIEGFGEISSHENRMILSYSSTSDGTIVGKIEIFDLSTDPPKLIRTRTDNFRQSLITKKHLFTVVKNKSRANICIEQNF
jgi:hypothetical protein